MSELSSDILIKLYESMQRIRLFEEKIVDLYPEQEMKCPVHLCIGQEAIATGVCANLAKDDYVFSNHRGHGHALAKGAAMKALMAEFYGKKTGCSGGKGGSMHIIDVERGMLGTSAIVGGGIPMGVGAALASKMKKLDRVTVIFFGDGASEEGVFYESFNFAALKKLPVVFVCENNLYATNSPQWARQASCRIVDASSPFGVRGKCIDGNDVEAVHEAAKAAIEDARSGKGPSLIEASTYRWKGHVGPEEDHLKGARPAEELTEWKKICPIKRFTKRIIESKSADENRLKKIVDEINNEIDKAVKFAKESPLPGPEDLLSNIYSAPKAL